MKVLVTLGAGLLVAVSIGWPPAARASHEPCASFSLGGDDSEVNCEPNGAVSWVRYCDDHDSERDNDIIWGGCVSVPGAGIGTSAVDAACTDCCGKDWAAAPESSSQDCCHMGLPGFNSSPPPEYTPIRCPTGMFATRVRYDSRTGCESGGWSVYCVAPPAGWILSASPSALQVIIGVTAENCSGCPHDGVTQMPAPLFLQPPPASVFYWCDSPTTCAQGATCPTSPAPPGGCFSGSTAESDCLAAAGTNCAAAPTCTLSFSPSSGPSGTSVTYTWSSNNDADGQLQETTCPEIPDLGAPSGSSNFTATTNTSCTLTVRNTAGTTNTCSASFTASGLPTCSISGPGSIALFTPFNVSWSNSPGLTRIESLGWFGPISPLLGSGPLAACPPDSGCTWGGLQLTASGTAGVTIEVEDAAGINRCSYSVISAAGPPPVCSPSNQPANTGDTVTLFVASGGNGTFSWSTSGGCSPCSGTGASFSTAFSSGGTKFVTLTSDGQTDTCTVDVSAVCTTPGCGSTTPSFPVGAGLPVRVTHINQLRACVQRLWTDAGLAGAIPWGEAIAANITTIKRDHIIELRNRINQVYTTGCGLPAPAWTPITAGVTPVGAGIMNEVWNNAQNAP